MSDYIHKEHPKTVGKTEFWKQIKRTVNGREVSDKDIAMIIDQVINNLKLAENDSLLDFGCGNGALASRLFPFVNEYTGVDFSEYLLEVAKEYFQPTDNIKYYLSDIISFLKLHFLKMQPNKILMYGVMSYLKRDEVAYLFAQLVQKESLKRVFLGNLPNSKFAKEFYQNRDITDFDLDDAKSSIGVWWHSEEICELAEIAGFTPQVLFMPDDFYSSKYRFDLILEKN